MRPMTYETPEALEAAIDGYFEKHPQAKDWTLTGLCIHCGITRKTLYNYEERDEFRRLVEMAKNHIEHSYELMLKAGGGASAIFGLKNFGWKDHINTQISDPNGNPIAIQPIQVILPANGREAP